MKRFELVQKLINEGLSEKTLVNLSDKQLGDLAERMLGEQSEQSTGKGSVVMNKGTADLNAVKKFTDAGTNVELREKKGGVGSKVTKGHNGIPEFMDSEKLKEKKPSKEKKKETTETKEWVESLAEEKFFHILTSKNEIMEMIATKMKSEVVSEELSPLPDFLKWSSLKAAAGKMKKTEMQENGTTTAPVKPKVDPGTKPKHPLSPGKFPKQKPKAEKEEDVQENGTKTVPVKPKVDPGTKPKHPLNPGKFPKQKPKALAEKKKD